MKLEFDKILNNLPDKPPRSRLEPYRDLIEELRRRKRTFQEIAELLSVNCRVQVTGSGIHDFLRRRARPTKSKVAQLPLTTKPAGDSAPSPIQRLNEQRPRQEDSTAFDFDPGEPLTLTKFPRH